jgi:hypothetical protein
LRIKNAAAHQRRTIEADIGGAKLRIGKMMEAGKSICAKVGSED